MDVALLIALNTIYGILAAISFVYLGYLLYRNKAGNYPLLEDEQLPFVSIIVPTYYEEDNIERCLESLSKLDYPKNEIIVVDGGSKDRTVSRAMRYADTIIVDSTLPEGWIGKSYGCHLGYQVAKGDLFLFTDADTYHEPESLKHAVSTLKGSNSMMLTLLPYQKAERWYEYLLGYYFFLSWLVAGAIEEINDVNNPNAFLAIGQYLLFEKECYEGLNGHVSIYTSIVEDLALAKRCKKMGYKMHFMKSRKLVKCRMHPGGIQSLLEGFNKSIIGGFQTLSKRRVMYATFWIINGISAPVFVALAVLYRPYKPIGITFNVVLYLVYAVTLTFYWIHKGDSNPVFSLLYPIGLLVVIISAIVALVYLITGTAIKWKNRTYAIKKDKKTKKSEKEQDKVDLQT